MATKDTDDLALGVVVYDEASGRRGTVADTSLSADLVFLRPIGGGIEWRARRAHLRPVLMSEVLAEQLRETRTSPPGEK